MPHWEEGRQGSGYSKLKIIESERFKLDVLILKYPPGSFIEWHTDPSPEGYEHHRLNVVLKKAFGGEFSFDAPTGQGITTDKRIIKFRPDVMLHRVKTIDFGTRYVLSIGWLKKTNKD